MDEPMRTTDRPGGGGGSPDVPELLHHLGTHMHAIGSRFAATEDLHQTDVQALSILAMHGGRLTSGELARQLELSTGATTRLVDRLERVGHVAREPDDRDRRRRYISITPSAVATAGAFFGQIGSLVTEVLAEYRPEERELIRRFLNELIAAMDRPPRREHDDERPATDVTGRT